MDAPEPEATADEGDKGRSWKREAAIAAALFLVGVVFSDPTVEIDGREISGEGLVFGAVALVAVAVGLLGFLRREERPMDQLAEMRAELEAEPDPGQPPSPPRSG